MNNEKVPVENKTKIKNNFEQNKMEKLKCINERILRKKPRRQMNCFVNARGREEKFPHQLPMMGKCNRKNKSLRVEKEMCKQRRCSRNLRLVIFNSIINKFERIGIPPKQLMLTACLLLLIQFPVAFGACREEPSRDCEAICADVGNTTTFAAPGYYGNSCIIRAVVLLPDDDNHVAALNRVLPVLKVAEEQIRQNQLIPQNIRFEWIPKDDKCDASYAVINAMDGTVKSCAHVFFGPVCDYALAPVSRLVKYFNSEGTPLITVGGFTYDFKLPKTNCTSEFYMLLRTGTLSFESMAQLTIDVMKRYKWSRSVFFYDPNGQKNVAGEHTCFLMLNSLGKQMRKGNHIFSQYQLNMKITNRTEEMKREIGKTNARPLKFKAIA